MTSNHAKADSPLYGKESKLQMATVVGGQYADQTVCVMVEYTDGWCICDLGEGLEAGDQGMQLIRVEQLQFWRSVKSVSNVNGVVVIEPLEADA